jgi:two-component system, NarL family, invasion response regulator UvrY
MIRVLLADDHPIVREGLKRILEAVPDVAVVGEAASGPEAVDLARRHRAEVVLLDVSMPGRGGIETAHDLKRAVPGVRILILTVHAEDHYAIRCLREGADGYLTKDAAPQLLVEAVRKIHGGGKYISLALAERLALNLDAGFERPPHERLSAREFEIMLQIAGGKTVGEIASGLNLSVKTVSTYRARILEKMSLKNNAEIMRYAMQQGLEA